MEEQILSILKSEACLQNPQTIMPEDIAYWELCNNRCFFIDYEFEDEGIFEAQNLKKFICNINMKDMATPVEQLKPIYIFISSGGGSLTTGYELADMIAASRTPVITIAIGNTMSAAFLVFLAGKKRYVFKHSQLLCHQGQIENVSGNVSDVNEATKNYKLVINQMKSYILERTEIPEKVFNKNRNKDWYFTEDELVNYRICDKIITEFTDILF